MQCVEKILLMKKYERSDVKIENDFDKAHIRKKKLGALNLPRGLHRKAQYTVYLGQLQDHEPASSKESKNTGISDP